MKKWEYMQTTIDPAYLPFELNLYGEDGWECIAVLDKESWSNPVFLVIFKKESTND